MDIENMLVSYRTNIGRCAHIECLIAMKNAQIEAFKKTMIKDMVSTTHALTGMPRGTTPGDPVGRLAAAITDGAESAPIMELREEVYMLESELATKRRALAFVDAWLLCINDRERFVVNKHVIDGETWQQVITDFSDSFGVEYSKDSLRKIKNRALEKIRAIAG